MHCVWSVYMVVNSYTPSEIAEYPPLVISFFTILICARGTLCGGGDGKGVGSLLAHFKTVTMYNNAFRVGSPAFKVGMVGEGVVVKIVMISVAA